jgi:peptidoglycan/LPS O-acetylase OafA/YrhL
MGVNLAPYLFYFLLGAIAYLNWDRIGKWYKGKGLFWLAAYLLYYTIFSVWLKKFTLSYWTGFYHIIAVILLSQTTISLAFSYKSLSTRGLRHNDISFGIYSYHMPVINVLLALGYAGNDYTILIALTAILLLAVLSWKFVEKPALLRKRKTINRLSI